MEIGALRSRITFQKQTSSVDGYKNHTNTWEDYFSCWATGSYSSGDEGGEEIGQTTVKESYDFTCRYCSELAVVTPNEYRIAFNGNVYNILSINPNAWKKNSLRFHCERERK